MASPFASTCWPSRFFAKWLAVFFAASLLGIVLGALIHKRPPPKLSAPPVRVQLSWKAYEVYTDGSKVLVPAHVTTGGIGGKPIPESDQGTTSTDPKKPLLISRIPGSKLWLIFEWQGHVIPRLTNPWPQSTEPYTVTFNLKRPNPHRKSPDIKKGRTPGH
ncbi:MAG: hypothetical protein M3Y13_04460 [Armatimonadota bacterium]|nr:hypothetical protein [Armatimonadota bacterium]